MRTPSLVVVGLIAAGSLAIAQNWLDLDAEQAWSNFDQRHAVTAHDAGARANESAPSTSLRARPAKVSSWDVTPARFLPAVHRESRLDQALDLRGAERDHDERRR